MEGVESLPGELARGVSQLYQIDIQTRVVLGKLKGLCEQSANALTDEEKSDLLAKLQKAQLELRAIGDEKMAVASSMQETVSVQGLDGWVDSYLYCMHASPLDHAWRDGLHSVCWFSACIFDVG